MSVYEKLGQDIGKLVDDKQAAYGDSFATAPRILRELYPTGIRVDQYDDMLTLVRMIDKMTRISKGNKTAFGESPYRDIVGYGLLGARKDEQAIKATEVTDRYSG